MREKKTVYIHVGAEDTWVRIGNATTRYSGVWGFLKLIRDVCRLQIRDRKTIDYIIETS